MDSANVQFPSYFNDLSPSIKIQLNMDEGSKLRRFYDWDSGIRVLPLIAVDHYSPTAPVGPSQQEGRGAASAIAVQQDPQRRGPVRWGSARRIRTWRPGSGQERAPHATVWTRGPSEQQPAPPPLPHDPGKLCRD